MSKKKSKIETQIEKALKLFPKIVKQKKTRYKERQAFLKKTFGPLMKELKKELKKS